MRLLAVIPVIGDTFNESIGAEIAAWVRPDTRVEVVALDAGPASVECEFDEALAVPGLLHRLGDATGVDAAYLVCFGDPGVTAARARHPYPIVGGFEPAMYIAMALGERIGVVTVIPNVLPALRALVHRRGLANRVAAIRDINLPVLDLHEPDVLYRRLHSCALDLAAGRIADVIVLGCGGMVGVAKRLQDDLSAGGYQVPVVDQTAAAVTWLESTVALRHSGQSVLRPAAAATQTELAAP